MAADVEDQLLNRIKKVAILCYQLDESTDVSKKALLLCYVRYEFEGDAEEELLCSLEIPGRCTSSEIFRVLDFHFEARRIPWNKCIGVCTDGASNMWGHINGVVALVKKVAHPNIVVTHCMIHREQLAAKQLSPSSHSVLGDAIGIINDIRAKPSNSRLFEALCDELGAQHSHLLFHAEVRRLSRGEVLARLHSLLHEMRVFLQQQDKKSSELVKLLNDKVWLGKLAYLADVFAHLNELNVSLQGPHNDIFTLRDRTDAFSETMLFSYKLESKGCQKVGHR